MKAMKFGLDERYLYHGIIEIGFRCDYGLNICLNIRWKRYNVIIIIIIIIIIVVIIHIIALCLHVVSKYYSIKCG